MSARKPASTKRQSEVIDQMQSTAVLDKVKGITLTKTVEQLGQQSLAVQKGMAELMATMQSEITTLEEIQRAIEIKKGELLSLRNIEVSATTLDDLKHQIEETKASWATEQEEHERSIADRNALREQEWKRENDQHKYEVDQRNKKATDEYNTLVATNKRDEAVRQQELARNWQERESKIAARETEIKAMEERIAGIDAEVKAAVDKQVAIVSNSMKREHEHALQMQKVTSDSAAQIAASTINQHVQNLAAKDNHIKSLTDQLSQANQRIEAIAKQAVESSSGREALKALQQQSETLATGTNGKR